MQIQVCLLVCVSGPVDGAVLDSLVTAVDFFLLPCVVFWTAFCNDGNLTLLKKKKYTLSGNILLIICTFNCNFTMILQLLLLLLLLLPQIIKAQNDMVLCLQPGWEST